MRLALISDVHGNLEALTAVLKDIETRDIDEIVSLGDVIGYGCDPCKCLELVDQCCQIKLLGNHEAAVLGRESMESYNESARESVNWTQTTLSDRELSVIESFRIDCVMDDIYLVHASPNEPTQWHYLMRPSQAGDAFGAFSQWLCFGGHTHVPVIFTEMEQGLPRQKVGHSFVPNEDTRYLINVGSVGQPRDNDPRSSYVVFDRETGDVEFVRVEYDVEAAQRKMRDAQLPDFLSDRLAVGR